MLRLNGFLIPLLLSMAMTGQAQTCRDNILATAPDSRFQDNGDGTVTDLATGLIWKRCAEGLSGSDCTTGSASLFTWQGALNHAADHAFAGSTLWRLPNHNELISLVERSCNDPAINSGFFPNTPTAFWSSSPSISGYYAFYVSFSDGHSGRGAKRDGLYLRLVRSGQ